MAHQSGREGAPGRKQGVCAKLASAMQSIQPLRQRDFRPGFVAGGSSAAVHILRELDRSLRRLQTDVIDLYILHWPDRHVPLETTLSGLATAVRQGKIRHFGASNHSAWQLCEMLWMAERQGAPRVVSSQIPFSLLRREFQHDLPFCVQHGIGVTPYQALQAGLLTGKYHRGQPPPADSRAAE